MYSILHAYIIYIHKGMLTDSKHNQSFTLYFASAIVVYWCEISTDVGRLVLASANSIISW